MDMRVLRLLFITTAMLATAGANAQILRLTPDNSETCGGEQRIAVTITDSVERTDFQFDVLFDHEQYAFIRAEKGVDTLQWALVDGFSPSDGLVIIGGVPFNGPPLNGTNEVAVLVFQSLCASENCATDLTLTNPTDPLALESASVSCGPPVEEGEGEGGDEGEPEGSTEGEPEGSTEGEPEGSTEGEPEGSTEGEGEVELDNPPVAVCQNITVALPVEGFVIINASQLDGGSTDDRGPVSFSSATTTFFCSDLGDNEVTLRVTDSAGQVSTCTATVTVVDNRVSNIVCQNYFTYVDVDGTVTVDVEDVDNGSTDNCEIASMTLSQTVFTCEDIGRNSVELTVTDVNGNTETCRATVTVRDILFACVEIPTYRLTANQQGQGAVTIETAPNADDGISYQEGTRVTLRQTPDTGWVFKEWSGDIAGATFGTNSITVPMIRNRTVTAIFEEAGVTDTCGCAGGKSNPFDNLGDLVLSLATLSALAMMAGVQRKFWS